MKRPGYQAGARKDKFKGRLGRRPYSVSPPLPSIRELARLVVLSRRAPILGAIEGGRP